ncbi:hypothetical protein D9M70_639000 [compost metagenome]
MVDAEPHEYSIVPPSGTLAIGGRVSATTPIVPISNLPQSAAVSASPFAGTLVPDLLPSARCTNSVVARLVSLSNCGGVGADGDPVIAGEANGAAPKVARMVAASTSSSRVRANAVSGVVAKVSTPVP